MEVEFSSYAHPSLYIRIYVHHTDRRSYTWVSACPRVCIHTLICRSVCTSIHVALKKTIGLGRYDRDCLSLVLSLRIVMIVVPYGCWSVFVSSPCGVVYGAPEKEAGHQTVVDEAFDSRLVMCFSSSPFIHELPLYFLQSPSFAFPGSAQTMRSWEMVHAGCRFRRSTQTGREGETERQKGGKVFESVFISVVFPRCLLLLLSASLRAVHEICGNER